MSRAKKTWRAWTSGELARLATLVAEGRTAPQCAAALGRSLASVRCRITMEGHRRVRTRRQEWIELLCGPHTLRGAAERLGVSVWAVKTAKTRLRNLGLPVVRLRREVDPRRLPRLKGWRRKLAAAHVGLAEAAARAFSRRWPAMANEAESAALAGLCKAAIAFDPDRRVPFPAFARARIHGAILDAAREELPKGYRRDKWAAPKVASLDADLGDGPTLAGQLAARGAPG